MSFVIKAEGLGKYYDLSRGRARPNTIIEVLDHWLRPWNRSAAPPAGDFWALRNIGFEIQQGDTVGLIGRNGAGKSTLLKILSRVTDPSEGSVRIRGRVASLLEVGTGFHGELSGRENVYLNGAILGMKRFEVARRFEQIVDYAGVSQFIDVPVKRYSSGMYLRLAFAVAAHLESEILIVDEVLAVGDVAFQEKCLGTMHDAARSGRTVLFVSHNLSAVSRLTRRCILLDSGHVAFDGEPAAAIRYYVGVKQQHSASGRVPVAEIRCERHLRLWDHVVIAEMGLAENQPQEIPVGGGLRLEFVLHAKTPFRGLRIAYSINNDVGQPVITGISPAFNVREGRQLYELDLTALNVVPGDYDLSVNLGTGGLYDPKGEGDSYMSFGHLVVAPRTVDGHPFGAWHNKWAPAVHTSAILRELPLDDVALDTAESASA